MATKRKYTLTLGEHSQEVVVWREGADILVGLGEAIHQVSVAMIQGDRFLSLLIDGESYEVHARGAGGGFELLVGSEPYFVDVQRGHRPAGVARSHDASPVWILRAPMAGIVTEIAVEPGQPVERGAVLLVLESMKMNNELRAERSGVVAAIHVSRAQRVERGTPLIQVGPFSELIRTGT